MPDPKTRKNSETDDPGGRPISGLLMGATELDQLYLRPRDYLLELPCPQVSAQNKMERAAGEGCSEVKKVLKKNLAWDWGTKESQRFAYCLCLLNSAELGSWALCVRASCSHSRLVSRARSGLPQGEAESQGSNPAPILHCWWGAGCSWRWPDSAL